MEPQRRRNGEVLSMLDEEVFFSPGFLQSSSINARNDEVIATQQAMPLVLQLVLDHLY